MDLQTVAHNVKATTQKQQQEHVGIHLTGNRDTLGMGVVIQQRPLHQKLMFPSDTSAHPTQSHCTLRTIGSLLRFPPICELLQVSLNSQIPVLV